MAPRRIKYKGRTYELRYKTPEEWLEFGRLNPRINPEFWDSPVISKDKTDFSDSPISTVDSPYEKLQKRFQRSKTRPSSYNYDSDEESLTDKEFAQKRTEESLRKRKALGEKRKQNKTLERKLAQQTKQVQQGLNQYQKAMYQAGHKTGRVVGVVERQKTKIITTVAKSIVMGWYFTGQLSLWVLSFALMGTGALAASTLSFVTKMVEALYPGGSALLLMPLIGGALGVAMLNAIISLAIVGGIVLLFSLTGIKSIGGNSKRPIIKKLLFGVAIVGYAFPLAQFGPWAYFWIRHVGNNPE